MLSPGYSAAAVSLLLLCLGCPGGDDDTTAGDDDTSAGDDDSGPVTCPGHFTISDESDLAAIYPRENITGDLVFDFLGWLTTIDLPLLTTVGGDVTIENNIALGSVDLSVEANGALPSLDELTALVSVDGDVSLNGNGALTSLAGLGGLESIGDNIFLETPSSGSAAAGTPGSPAYGTIMQGFIETSNVNPVSEITSLITAQRAYELNSKVITTSDEMMRSINTLR